MTPNFKQRLGLEPASLAPRERRALLAARSASLLFALQGALALTAAAIGGTLSGAVVGTAAVTLCFAALVFGAYERLPWVVNQLLAAGGVGAVAILVVVQPHGERYAFLFLAPVLYVAFFFRGRNAAVQLGVVSVLAAAALAAALPAGGAAETWTLLVGTLVQAAATTIVLRRNLGRASEQTRVHRSALDAFFLNAPGGFAFLDGDLRFRRVNATLAQLLGWDPDEIVGRSVGELAPERAAEVEALMRRVIDRGEPASGVELSSVDGDRHFLTSYFPVAGPDGDSGLGIAVTDVSQLKDVERRLEETNRQLAVLATTDELTGLPNRRMLGEQLELAIARAQRGGLAVALLCVDLDRFKDVNDSLGHAFGDDLLVEVAGRLRAGARKTDVVARYGGDEFMILLADLDVQTAAELTATVVERLRGLLAEPLAVGPVELRAHASIGVAVFPRDAGDTKGLLAAADAAMYAGKSALTRVA